MHHLWATRPASHRRYEEAAPPTGGTARAPVVQTTSDRSSRCAPTARTRAGTIAEPGGFEQGDEQQPNVRGNRPTQSPPLLGTNRDSTGPGSVTTGDRVHVVRADDTLYSIAILYYGDGSLWPQLAAYNIDRVPQNLQIGPGLQLRIPARDVLLGPAEPTRTPGAGQSGAETAGSSEYISYTVTTGDTLTELAQDYMGSTRRWQELYDLNREVIRDPDRLIIGTVIRIPSRSGRNTPVEPPTQGPARSNGTPSDAEYVSYTIQAGDTLTELAQEYMGTMRRWQELYDLNRDVIRDPDRPLIGTVIRIPRQ